MGSSVLKTANVVSWDAYVVINLFLLSLVSRIEILNLEVKLSK